jgi:DNA mismatch endonuclease (patch repair protein)
LAVFLDGCFWHRCPEHGNAPVHNAGYWEAKLGRNVERDVQVTRALEEAGWIVVRIWEHEPLDQAIAAVAAAFSP